MIRAPADDNGCRFGHHCCRRASNYIKIREVNRNKLINYYFNLLFATLILHPRPQPTPWMGPQRVRLCGTIISMSLAGRLAPPPWSWCFCQFVVCRGWSRDVTRPPYVKIGTKITLRKG
jgi:hypothetical protein